MKRYIAVVLLLLFVLTLCAGAFAKTVIVQGPYRTKIVKTYPRKTVIVKRYFYPKTTVLIVGKPFVVRPYKWKARVKVIAVSAPVRVYPHPSSSIITNVIRDSEYDALKRQGNWVFVKFEGREGWLSLDQLQVKKLEKVAVDKSENLQEENVPVEAGSE